MVRWYSHFISSFIQGGGKNFFKEKLKQKKLMLELRAHTTDFTLKKQFHDPI